MVLEEERNFTLRQESNKEKSIMNRLQTYLFYGLIAIGVIFTVMFLFNRSYWEWTWPLDAEAIGQYGDFIGGALGTFLTLLLLYVTFTLQSRTFSSQEKVSQKNIEMLAIQQLNDKFFKLYDVYKDILEKFSVLVHDEYLEGKSAIKNEYSLLYNSFNHQTAPGVRRKSAVIDFLGFYASHKDFAPAYFRTLNLMFEEISLAEDVAIEERLKYVRLMRAQFTDTELIFIRYNAMTPLGVDSIDYINRYNLLKHLPPMELMEYKEWRIHHQMTQTQVNGLNNLLLALKSLMIHSLDGEICKPIVSADNRYTLGVSVKSGFDTMKVVIERDFAQKIYPNDFQFEGLEGFPVDELKDFFLYFIKDCVVIQNFNRFNVRKELTFNGQFANDGMKEIITIMVVNNKQCRIAINYKQFKELQNRET